MSQPVDKASRAGTDAADGPREALRVRASRSVSEGLACQPGYAPTASPGPVEAESGELRAAHESQRGDTFSTPPGLGSVSSVASRAGGLCHIVPLIVPSSPGRNSQAQIHRI